MSGVKLSKVETSRDITKEFDIFLFSIPLSPFIKIIRLTYMVIVVKNHSR